METEAERPLAWERVRLDCDRQVRLRLSHPAMLYRAPVPLRRDCGHIVAAGMVTVIDRQRWMCFKCWRRWTQRG